MDANVASSMRRGCVSIAVTAILSIRYCRTCSATRYAGWHDHFLLFAFRQYN